MSKAENYIKEHIRQCSNGITTQTIFGTTIDNRPWLTPDQARKAVEIAREEIYEWLEKHKDISDYTWYDEIEHESGIIDKCITDLKQAMKDE